MYTPTTKHEYNVYKLPDKINFLKATQDLPLPRGAKSKFQLYISSMSKPKLKETIKHLESMMYDKLRGTGVSVLKGNIVIPDKILEKEKQKAIQEAIFTKAVHDFAEKYLTSLEYQKKI